MSRDPPRRDKTVNAIGESKPPRMLAGTKKTPRQGHGIGRNGASTVVCVWSKALADGPKRVPSLETQTRQVPREAVYRNKGAINRIESGSGESMWAKGEMGQERE